MPTYVGGILLSKSSALALTSDFQLLFPLSDYVAAPWVMNTRISVEVLMEIWDTLLSWSNIFATSNTGTLILTSVYFHVLDIFNLKWPQIRGPFNYLGGVWHFFDSHTLWKKFRWKHVSGGKKSKIGERYIPLVEDEYLPEEIQAIEITAINIAFDLPPWTPNFFCYRHLLFTPIHERPTLLAKSFVRKTILRL